jgi:hypothetical protein
MKRVSGAVTTKDEKGKALEDLVCYPRPKSAGIGVRR